eukprot:2738396-Prymnesium_polylepis.2
MSSTGPERRCPAAWRIHGARNMSTVRVATSQFVHLAHEPCSPNANPWSDRTATSVVSRSFRRSRS